MKPRIRILGGYWMCTVEGPLLDDKFDTACRFVEELNRKEGRWPWRMLA